MSSYTFKSILNQLNDFVLEYQLAPILIVFLITLAIVDYTLGLRKKRAIITFTFHTIKQELENDSELNKKKLIASLTRIQKIRSYNEENYNEIVSKFKSNYLNFFQSGLNNFEYHRSYADFNKKIRRKVADKEAKNGLEFIASILKILEDKVEKGELKEMPIQHSTTKFDIEELIKYNREYGSPDKRKMVEQEFLPIINKYV